METITMNADTVIIAYWIFVAMVLVSVISVASAWTNYEESRR